MFIGIDLGTSSVKLLLMDENGRPIKSATHAYPLHHPYPGWSEQDPEDWMSATMQGLRELLLDQDKMRVRGICASGQMHGLVILDESDKVIRPALLWNDGRTGLETKYLNQSIGTKLLVKETGNIAFAGFTAPKLIWLKKHEPEAFGRIRKIMLPKDFLTYRLSGQHVSDLSDASGTLLFDVRNQRWSHKMLDICELKQSYMPSICKGSDVVGTLRSEIASELGLSRDVKVMAGAGDNAAAAVGTGTVGEGRGNLSLGTSGTIFVSTDKFQPLKTHGIHQFCHTDGRYHLMGCMLSAACCHSWWQEQILDSPVNSQTPDDIQVDDNLFFLPYLMGERSPHNDEQIRGAFVGLSMNTSREEMSYAVLEGVSFGLRDSLEIIRSLGIPLNTMTVTGGGAHNAFWVQLLSNVLDAQLCIFEHEEGPAYGAAILAAVGTGVWPSVQEASNNLRQRSKFVSPSKLDGSNYQQKYERFVSLYPLLKSFFK